LAQGVSCFKTDRSSTGWPTLYTIGSSLPLAPLACARAAAPSRRRFLLRRTAGLPFEAALVL